MQFSIEAYSICNNRTNFQLLFQCFYTNFKENKHTSLLNLYAYYNSLGSKTKTNACTLPLWLHYTGTSIYEMKSTIYL